MERAGKCKYTSQGKCGSMKGIVMHKPNPGAAKHSPMSKPLTFCTPKTTQTLICLVTVSVIKVNQAQSTKQRASSWEFISSSGYAMPESGGGLSCFSLGCSFGRGAVKPSLAAGHWGGEASPYLHPRSLPAELLQNQRNVAKKKMWVLPKHCRAGRAVQLFPGERCRGSTELCVQGGLLLLER